MIDLQNYVRNIPDFPKAGINYKDITPLLQHPVAFRAAADCLQQAVGNRKIDKVVGIESRGFILGALLADRLSTGFVPVRKLGKLPSVTLHAEYALEYGTDTLEIHRDAIQPGEQVLLHDDLLATGGTARAACTLIEKLGGTVVQLSFLIELSFLQGRNHFPDHEVYAVMQYDT